MCLLPHGKGRSLVASGKLFPEMYERAGAAVQGCREALPGVLLVALVTHVQAR